jgi:hypothetical protein
MSVQWLESPIDPSTSPSTLGLFDSAPAFPEGPSALTNTAGDMISRTWGPPTQNNFFSASSSSSSSSSNGFSSIIQQLFSVIQQLMGQLGSGEPEQYFSSATGGSNGDPHLSFNASTWNDMNGEPDLLNSDSIRGGYQLSTQTTTPNANGVTYNQQATVTTDGGRTQISLNNQGNAQLTQDGVTTSIAPGQTLNLRNGETVTRNQNGSLQITCQNQSGGEIVTTMSENGQGVNVNAAATNVDLGGTLVNNAPTAPPQTTLPGRPVMRRYSDEALP